MFWGHAQRRGDFWGKGAERNRRARHRPPPSFSRRRARSRRPGSRGTAGGVLGQRLEATGFTRMNARSRARRKSRRAPEPRTVRVAPREGHALAGRRPGGAGLFHVRAVPRRGVRAGHRCGPGTAARSLRVGFPERAWPWAASLGRPSVATLSSRFSAPWLAVAGAGGQSSARADLVRRVLRGKNVDKRVGTRSRLLFGGGADAAGLAARPAAGASSRSSC